MNFFRKLVFIYLFFVDSAQLVARDNKRSTAHFLACMLVAFPFLLGYVAYIKIDYYLHPEIQLRQAAVSTSKENSKLEPIMKEWFKCFDNTLMNTSYAHCDREVAKMVEDTNLEKAFAKHQKWRDSQHEMYVNSFRPYPVPEPRDE